MASVVIDVAAEQDAGQKSVSSSFCRVVIQGDETKSLPVENPQVAAPAVEDAPNAPPLPKQELTSLEVFRGLAVVIMILAGDAGGAFPSISASPWTGLTLADLVLPFFLFSAGVSVALVFKKVPNRAAATKKALARTLKLFLLGLLLQGGYFHGRDNLTYGVDLDHIRWLGILQRISIGYFLAGMTEIWLVNDGIVDSAWSFAKRYYSEWVVAIILCSVYMGLSYGLYVPNWTFKVSPSASVNQTYGLQSENISWVSCGVRGNFSPACNAVGSVDRFFLGQNHLSLHPAYTRAKECSVNSPDFGPLPPNAPSWCLAPFDPEGILSSLTAAVTCFIGLHFGHIFANFKGHVKILVSWLITSLMLLLLGFMLKLIGLPLSKPLYTLSFLCVSAGICGAVLTALYYIVDVKQIHKPAVLLEWMGMNTLLVYALAACELVPAFIQGFYWHSPENNLMSLSELRLQGLLHSEKWGTLAFVLLEILFWCLFTGYLHRKRIYL